MLKRYCFSGGGKRRGGSSSVVSCRAQFHSVPLRQGAEVFNTLKHAFIKNPHSASSAQQSILPISSSGHQSGPLQWTLDEEVRCIFIFHIHSGKFIILIKILFYFWFRLHRDYCTFFFSSLFHNQNYNHSLHSHLTFNSDLISQEVQCKLYTFHLWLMLTSFVDYCTCLTALLISNYFTLRNFEQELVLLFNPGNDQTAPWNIFTLQRGGAL